MKDDKSILLEAHTRYQYADEQWAPMKTKNTELLDFIAGNQWDLVARQNFENAGFAARTSNRMPGILRQITNELRKNVPSIQVNAKDDGHVDTAEVLNDMLRDIQLDSTADVAYKKAAEFAASVGIGYFRIASKYEKNSMNQKLCIEPVYDINTIMLDPDHKALAGQDSEFAFVTVAMSHEEYKRRFPDSNLAENMSQPGWTAAKNNWVTKDMIMVCEYYFKDYEKKTLYQIRNTVTGEVTEDYDYDKELLDAGALKILQSRPDNVPIIRHCKLNDVEVLSKSIWPGCYIPIIAVKGDEYWIDNKRKLNGVACDMVESQISLNYYLSWQGQLIQLAPKAPYIGTAAQFKGYELEWENVNVSNQAFMTYNADGTAPPPSRDLGEVPIQNAGAMVQQAENDIRSVSGVTDLTQQLVNPESGKAILARQQQTYNANYHLYDNLQVSIAHAGVVLVDAISTFYDTERQIQAVKETGEKRSVKINTPSMDMPLALENDMSKIDGNYSVSVQTGKSYGTKRQEAVEAITAIMNLNPQMAQNLADLAIMQMDIPMQKELSARARAMVDPNVLAASQGDDKMEPEIVVQQLKMQNKQLSDQLTALNAHAGQVEQQLKISDQENKLQKMSKDVDLMKAELDYKLKTRDQDQKEATTELEFLVKQKELDMAQQQLDLQRMQLELNATKTMVDVSHRDMDMHEKRHKNSVSVMEVIKDPNIKDVPIETLDPGIDNQLGNSIDNSLE